MSDLSIPVERITSATPPAAPKVVAVYTVAVTYSIADGAPPTSQLFHFMCDIPGLQFGDLVVVKDRNGYALTKVVKLYETPGNKAKAWVVDKVDTSREDARKRRAELEAKLRSAIKDQELLEQGRQLAGNDPHIAALVLQLEQM